MTDLHHANSFHTRRDSESVSGVASWHVNSDINTNLFPNPKGLGLGSRLWFMSGLTLPGVIRHGVTPETDSEYAECHDHQNA